ncbi:MAG: hypothetical protein M1817_001866 [Caeruleum heppii]|nr:MAG: hypothetical protein M1817_001866 [Caeruleum heppii]
MVLGVRAIVDGDRTAPKCAALARTMKKQISYPDEPGYQTSLSTYWSALAGSLSPSCVMSPETTQNMATAMKTLVTGECHFAVRGGGHTPWAGAANVESGVTIDLGSMRNVTVSPDQKMVAVGGGARWVDVYSTLDPLNLTIPGGRVSDVGVGGLTLGGGMSFFAAQFGFVCDNVKNFEVVLSSGEVVNANAESHSDLFRALKGGSNNIGIVTRFDFYAVKQGPLLAGAIVNTPDTIDQQLHAFVEFTKNISSNPTASSILSYSIDNPGGVITPANFLVDTDPTTDAAAFQGFNAIQPQIANTLALDNLTHITETLIPFPNPRDLFITCTFKNDFATMRNVYDISLAGFEPINQITNLSWAFGFQPLPRVITDRSLQRGGNVLGLDRTADDLILFTIVGQYFSAVDDVPIRTALQETMMRIENYTRSVGTDYEWRYLNYALDVQHPISTYGSENVELLRRAARKYDPQGVFQKLVGGHKLASP